MTAANDVHIRPHKVIFYRCLDVGCVFLWLLNCNYKPLDIIEIMSNCNTNSQGLIYMSILQSFSKTLVAEVYIEIHMLQQMSLHARGKWRLKKILHFKTNKKVELLQFWACICLLRWQFISYSLMYVTFFSLMKHERVRKLIIPVFYKHFCNWF